MGVWTRATCAKTQTQSSLKRPRGKGQPWSREHGAPSLGPWHYLLAWWPSVEQVNRLRRSKSCDCGKVEAKSWALHEHSLVRPANGPPGQKWREAGWRAWPADHSTSEGSSSQKWRRLLLSWGREAVTRIQWRCSVGCSSWTWYLIFTGYVCKAWTLSSCANEDVKAECLAQGNTCEVRV